MTIRQLRLRAVIMEADTPLGCKILARDVAGFDLQKWAEAVKDIRTSGMTTQSSLKSLSLTKPKPPPIQLLSAFSHTF